MKTPSTQPLDGSTHMPGIILRMAKIPTRIMMRSFNESFRESKKGGLWALGLVFFSYLVYLR